MSVVTFENHWVLWWQRLNLTSRWWLCFFKFILWHTPTAPFDLQPWLRVSQSSTLLRQARKWEMWPRRICFYNKSCSNSPNTNEKSFNASFPLEVFVQWLPDSNCFISWTTHLTHSTPHFWDSRGPSPTDRFSLSSKKERFKKSFRPLSIKLYIYSSSCDRWTHVRHEIPDIYCIIP